MPSSTSSSEPQTPRGPWGRTWLLAGLLTAGLLGGWELYWRTQGFFPTRVSDEPLWLLAREKLTAAERPIALIGASRSQVGIDLDVFAARTGVRPVQLGICYSSPTPVLRELAEDATFAGLVICDVTPLLFFQSGGPVVERSNRYLARAHTYVSPADRLEWQLQLALETMLVTRLDRLAPEHFAECWAKGTWPEPGLGSLRADRMITAYYPPGFAAGRPTTVGPFKRNPYLADAARRDALLDQVAQDVERIRGRGGEVVFVVLPFTDDYRQKERALAPRAEYWDRLLARTGAPGIHFEDFPSLSGFDCPDGCHLDSRDAPRFTRALLDALQPALAGTAWELEPGAPLRTVMRPSTGSDR
ncbi:MAG: hypothetical protein KA383_04135 [Phycisphaerae bacterium]|nr:hypothetical protein [Phycisphaerae bacterium]